MGANPFVAGIEPGGKILIGNPPRGNPPAGSCYFYSHRNPFDDRIKFFVIITQYVRLDTPGQGRLRGIIRTEKEWRVKAMRQPGTAL
jgi:hypothetical protein